MLSYHNQIKGQFVRSGASNIFAPKLSLTDNTTFSASIQIRGKWVGSVVLESSPMTDLNNWTVLTTFTTNQSPYSFTGTYNQTLVYRLRAATLTSGYVNYVVIDNNNVDYSLPDFFNITSSGTSQSVVLSGGGTSSQTATASGFLAGATITFYKNGITTGVTGVADGTGTATGALTGLANGDVVTAQGIVSSTGATATVATSAVTYLPTVGTGTYAAVFGVQKLLSTYSGPLFAACATSEPITPVSPMDVYPIGGSDQPDIAAAIAAFGASFDIYKFYDQTGNGYDALSAIVAQRFAIDTNDTTFGLKGAVSKLNANAAVGGLAKISNSLSLSRQNFTMIALGCAYAQQDANALMSAGNSGGSFAIMYNDKHPLFGSVLADTGTFGARPGTVQPFIAAIAFGASTTTQHRNNDNNSKAAFSATTVTGGGLGPLLDASGAQFGTNHTMHKMLGWAFMSGQVSNADLTTIKTAAYAKYGIVTNETGIIAHHGDSIMLGYGSQFGRGLPIRLVPYLTARVVKQTNTSKGGQTLNTGNTEYASSAALTYDGTKAKNILHTQFGINDIIGNAALGDTSTPGTMIYMANTYINAAKATGYTVVWSTLLPSTSVTAGKETVRTGFNSYLIANAVSLGINVIDRSQVSVMTNPSNTTYFYDGTHPTDAGYQALADYEGPIINALL
jgi:lysophospholipase L1-like esterase